MGVSVFVIICSFILLNPSDFDHQLILQVDHGVSAEVLIPQIDEKAFYMRKNAKHHLDSVIMDRRYWGNGDLANPEDLRAYVDQYRSYLNSIDEYRDIRIKFVKREISKEEFLNSARSTSYFVKLAKLD